MADDLRPEDLELLGEHSSEMEIAPAEQQMIPLKGKSEMISQDLGGELRPEDMELLQSSDIAIEEEPLSLEGPPTEQEQDFDRLEAGARRILDGFFGGAADDILAFSRTGGKLGGSAFNEARDIEMRLSKEAKSKLSPVEDALAISLGALTFGVLTELGGPAISSMGKVSQEASQIASALAGRETVKRASPALLREAAFKAGQESGKRIAADLGPEAVALGTEIAATYKQDAFKAGMDLARLSIEGGAFGAAEANPKTPEEAVIAFGRGAGWTALIGGFLKGVGFAADELTSEVASRSYKFSKQEGKLLSSPRVQAEISDNLENVPKALDGWLTGSKNLLNEKRNHILNSNSDVKVELGSLFKEARDELQGFKSTQPGAAEAVRKYNELLDMGESSLLPMSDITPGVSIRNKEALIGDADNFKIQFSEELFDKESVLKKNSEVDRLAKKFRRKLNAAINNADITGELSSVNDVLSGLQEAEGLFKSNKTGQIRLNSGRWASLANNPDNLKNKSDIVDFEEVLQSIPVESRAKHAPGLIREYNAITQMPVKNYAVLRQFQKTGHPSSLFDVKLLKNIQARSSGQAGALLNSVGMTRPAGQSLRTIGRAIPRTISIRSGSGLSSLNSEE